MKTLKHMPIIVLGWGVLFGNSGLGQTTTNSWLGGSDDWDNGGQWSLGNPPSPTDVTWITNNATSYTVGIDSGTVASTLTNYALTVGGLATTTQTLSVVSAPSPLVVWSTFTNQSGGRTEIIDSAFTVGTGLVVRTGTFIMDGDSMLRVLASGGVTLRNNGVMVLSGTNATLTGGFNIGSATIGNGFLFVTNTHLTANNISVSQGNAVIVNTGLALTNDTGFFSVNATLGAASSLTFEGGHYVNTVAQNSLFVSGSGSVTVSNRGAYWLSRNLSVGNSVGSGSFVLDSGTNIVRINGASTGALRILAGNGTTAAVTVVNGSLLTADGGNGIDLHTVTVGAAGTGVGVFRVSDSTVLATNNSVNGPQGRFFLGRAIHSQSNSFLMADRVEITSSVLSFSVDADSEIRVRSAAGFSNAAPLAVSNDFRFDGKLTFTPASGVVTQTLRLAGLDLGGNILGFSNNFSLGELDLSSFGPSHRLQLLSSHAESNPALYVGAISSIATNALISSFNVFYLPELNPDLYFGAPQGTYLLSGNGFLLPIPEPTASLLIVAAGLLGASCRSRRTHGA